MPRYNFDALSSQDFEELSRDLLQAEWGLSLEAFKSGRDKGIDLRHILAGGDRTIIQCKHYSRSGLSQLLHNLAKLELPKIQRLKPDRYLVLTSLGLTPDNKDSIVRLLAPFIISPNDILGADDIEGLLARHPAVERRNFKLWLTSTEVIERVVHNAEICHTEFEVGRIRTKLPRFVQSSVFPQAMQMLKHQRIVVISGPPGIGKTTLAEMLLYSYLEQGFEPVVINGEISEGKKFFRSDLKRIFYYDDFLGQIYLGDRTEYLGKNQDAALSDFLEMVRQSEHSRFILTTRAHILSSALQFSERLARSALAGHRCVLELSSYTFGNRARILYNHLYFSGLPSDYKRAVLKEEFFLEIIRHDHFNPRLIEWLSTEVRERDVSPKNYREYIQRLLDSPHEIWAGSFKTQLSHQAQDVLLSFYTLGEGVAIIDIEPAFRSLRRLRSAKYNRLSNPGEFRDALRELDGAFLTYANGYARYLNPSIREFIASLIFEDRDTSQDLLDSTIRFRQVAALQELSEQHPDSPLAAMLAASVDSLPQLFQSLFTSPTMRWERSRHEGLRGYYIDLGDEARISFLARQTENFRSFPLFQLTKDAVQRLTASWNNKAPSLTSIINLLQSFQKLEWFIACGGQAVYKQLLEAMLQQLMFTDARDWISLSDLPAQVVDWTTENQQLLDQAFQEYCDNGLDEERSNLSDVDDMGALLQALQELGVKRKHDFGAAITHLQQDIAEAEEEEEDEEALSAGESFPREVSSETVDHTSDDDVREMFASLGVE